MSSSTAWETFGTLSTYLKLAQPGILAFEAHEISVVSVEDLGVGGSFEGREQVRLVFAGIRRRRRVTDRNGFRELTPQEQAVEVAVQLSQIGEVVGRDR